MASCGYMFFHKKYKIGHLSKTYLFTINKNMMHKSQTSCRYLFSHLKYDTQYILKAYPAETYMVAINKNMRCFRPIWLQLMKILGAKAWQIINTCFLI